MPEPPHEQRPLIELGWILYGSLEKIDIQAARAAQSDMLTAARQEFPGFEWRMPWVERPDPVQDNRQEPVVLLDYGRTERELRHWDFALVVTAADLRSYYRPFTVGIPSRALGVGVVSTHLIDPQAQGEESQEAREAVLRARILAVAWHLFGHLNGLRHDPQPCNRMFAIEQPIELDGMRELDEGQRQRLRDELADVADLRLEERPDSRRLGTLWFYMRAARIGADDILGTLAHARPWEFPFRLSRLTTAAVSALLILMMTAEAWDVGMSCSPGFVIGLSVTSLLATSLYILKRQQLLLGRGSRRLTEQTAVSNIAVTIVVGFGMTTTYGLLFIVCLFLSQLAFGTSLVLRWAESLDGRIALADYVVFAGFIASLGILIGALGASFEGQNYFRHVAYVDEEV